MDYQGRVAVVTGGGSGIGRSLALAFARRGAHVVVDDIDAAALASVAGEIERGGSRVLAQRVDVGDAKQMAGLADAAYEAFGAVHVVCNNAGVAVGGRLKD